MPPQTSATEAGQHEGPDDAPTELDDIDLLERMYNEDDDDSFDDESDPEQSASRAQRARKTPEYGKSKPGRAATNPAFQPRGLLEPATRGSKEVQRLFAVGPAKEDQTPALQALFKWSGEPTTPTRKPNAGGFGGFATSFFLNPDALKRESVDDWEWYELDGAKETFACCQTNTPLEPADAQTYMPPAESPGMPFLMGSFKNQRLFRLPVGASVDLNEAWQPNAASSDETSPPQDPKSLRAGWMLNLGQKIQDMDWAPNHIGPQQYLAVCTLPTTPLTSGGQPSYKAAAPAFTPQEPQKSSIQIWEFVAGADGRPDLQCPPRLTKVICTMWGDVKAIKWCPTVRRFEESLDQNLRNLGLLAVIFGDGALRVLDIFVTTSSVTSTEYTLLTSAAFCTRPPNTVIACMTWISSSSVAAGCANGAFGVWNIASALQTAQSTTGPDGEHSAEPVLYASLATTYIRNLTSCAPSRPHIIIATTMAGHIYMIDLLDMPSTTSFGPTTTIRSTRSRLSRYVLAWHDWSQMVLSSDDNFTLVTYSLRRFFRQTGCTRYKSSLMALAISPVHPFVLTGGVGGEVTCTNPTRRAYETKVPIWNQQLFTHEWRALGPGEVLSPGGPDGVTATEDADIEHSGAAAEEAGVSRILEGYKPELIKLFNTDEAFNGRNENGSFYTTVYDLKTSVTALCWNPNIHVGGWMAAGLASGLLRIEDVAS